MPRLPLADAVMVRAELEDTLEKLDRLHSSRPVSEDHVARRVERQRILERWRDDLQGQLDEMLAADRMRAARKAAA